MGFSAMLEDGRCKCISHVFVSLLLTYFRAVPWSLSSGFQQLEKKKKKLSGAIVVSALLCFLEQVPKSIRPD
jgi:hypothetical protein